MNYALALKMWPLCRVYVVSNDQIQTHFDDVDVFSSLENLYDRDT